jgi:uncharacterized protein YceK
MLRFFIVLFLISCCLTGCASTGVYRSFSEINNEPIKEVKSFSITEDGSYRLCVVGKLRNNGFGEYQIFIHQEKTRNTVHRCRNNLTAKYDGKYFCTEYTIPIIVTKDEDVLWQCQTAHDGFDSKCSAIITGKDSRILTIRDSKNLDIAEIHIAEVWEGTNPIAYLFMPFTIAFDVVTLPIQVWIGLAMGNR